MQYEKNFKEEAVKLADEIGAKKAAEDLGVSYYTILDWRKAKREAGEYAFVGSGRRRPTPGKTSKEQELEKENRELRRANEILKDALGFFAQDRKK
ncbi:MAG: transposase [Clostridiales Family XIII bacterium]|nr:transposase [Clostridiales Family XIII bacterium]